ncbi:murein L,D-transpeptidase catalytic domain-containing protein [Dysgonomonas sp. BGC7]|uniref:murein L,D-transpeptidase catalytic domain-containing protein n=1 Tax=Dysgonomonas sp. BGC7 TaxID=1658008 RepID=UPI000681FADB|nr:murein L,D-transpeptidase catalytic domain family protein [Dysgonomonas sp. BGC7]MBD8390257.1 murein L,D-transpeptidase catalytic domain family protein [Dysgonomonas sp. BGC7]
MNREIPYTLIILLFVFSFIMCGNVNSKTEDGEGNKELAEKKAAFARLKAKADSAQDYIKKKGLNQKYCILIDFSIHSGKNRFFVWDFANDTIKYTSLCCHGYGLKSTHLTPVFSNTEGSYCSSLGKYKLGIRSYSNWGINVHYKMHGLEKTNSNAFRRMIVLHSHSPVSEKEIYPRHLPLGWSQGCPVINDNIMRKVDILIQEEKSPILIWIYI